MRELSQHVEFEPQTYYAAFSAELEASASPMWALVSHLRDSDTRHYTFSVLRECLRALSTWFKSVGFSHTDLVSKLLFLTLILVWRFFKKCLMFHQYSIVLYYCLYIVCFTGQLCMCNVINKI